MSWVRVPSATRKEEEIRKNIPLFLLLSKQSPKGRQRGINVKIVGILLTEYPYIIGRNQLPKPVLVQKSLLSQNVQNSWKLIPIFCILYQSHLIVLPSLLYQASDKTTRYHLIEIRIQKEYFIFQKHSIPITLLFRFPTCKYNPFCLYEKQNQLSLQR